jgi:hypothetical protein
VGRDHPRPLHPSRQRLEDPPRPGTRHLPEGSGNQFDLGARRQEFRQVVAFGVTCIRQVQGALGPAFASLDSHKPVPDSQTDGLSADRLRTIVQDSHLNFLIGAGTPAAYFGLLGNIEDALTELASSTASNGAKAIVRASIQAYFFDEVLAPGAVTATLVVTIAG